MGVERRVTLHSRYCTSFLLFRLWSYYRPDCLLEYLNHRQSSDGERCEYLFYPTVPSPFCVSAEHSRYLNKQNSEEKGTCRWLNKVDGELYLYALILEDIFWP